MASDSLEWLAGILEGEGCFSASTLGGSPLIRLAMTDCDVVERAAAVAPGATRVKRRAHSQPNRKDVYMTSWSGKPAYDLSWRLMPLLGERRSEKVLTVLADWLDRRMCVCLVCEKEFSTMTDVRAVVCGAECRRVRKNLNQNASRALRMGR